MRGLWWWRPCVAILVPLALLPIVLDACLPAKFPNDNKQIFDCLYVVCVTVVFWVVEVVPLPVTAFLPLILFPFFGIGDGKELAMSYFKDTNFVLVGSFMVAAAFEEAELHRRIALRVLLLMGSDPRLLLLGFLLAGGFLSMWLANAAVVAMLLPPAFAIINQLAAFSRPSAGNPDGDGGGNGDGENLDFSLADIGTLKRDTSVDSARPESERRIASPPKDLNAQELLKTSRPAELHIYQTLLFGICYASNIGGTGTLTGTPPTIVLQGLIAKNYPGSHEITYAKWMGYAMPPVILALLLGYVILLLWMEIPGHATLQRFRKANLAAVLRQQHRELGPFKFQEMMALLLFCLLFLVWFFRDPGFPGFEGWVAWFPAARNAKGKTTISIGAATMGVAFLLFLLPREAPWSKSNRPQAALLSWPVAQKKIPWGVLLLVGGGYAMADGIDKSHLSDWIGQRLNDLDGLSPFMLMLIAVIMAGVMTEFTSNVVVVEVLVKILGELGVSQGLNPLYLILPAVLKSSFAFMLPVATPPNALIFSFGLIKVWQMMTVGLLFNIMCVGVCLLQGQFYGAWFYDLHSFPSWANATKTTTTASTLVTTLNTSTSILTSTQ